MEPGPLHLVASWVPFDHTGGLLLCSTHILTVLLGCEAPVTGHLFLSLPHHQSNLYTVEEEVGWGIVTENRAGSLDSVGGMCTPILGGFLADSLQKVLSLGLSYR